MAPSAILMTGDAPSVVSQTKTPAARRDVSTIMYYYDDPGDGSKPLPVLVKPNTVKNERKMIATEAVVEDITGREILFNLDDHAFQLLQRPTAAASCIDTMFEDEEKIASEYYDDCIQLLKETTGASRIFIFGHSVRQGPSNWHKLGEGNAKKRGPLRRVHVDNSYDGAEFLVKYYVPDDADDLLKRRYQIINVWRPIETIRKDPLAVTDGRSVPDEDLVEAEIVYTDHVRKSWTIKSGLTKEQEAAKEWTKVQHRWYFKNEQSPDEALLIKCFDSIDDGSVARRTAHSAFIDPSYEDADPRHSIEVRALVFY